VSNSAVVSDPRDVVQEYIRSRKFTPDTMLALRQIVNDIANELNTYHAMANVPPQCARNFRNDMYLTSEAFRLLRKQGTPTLSAADWSILENQKAHRPGNKVHPGVGKSRGRDGPRAWHYGRLEASRGHRRREDR
jgi:PiT family inorganic phosphate transporter